MPGGAGGGPDPRPPPLDAGRRRAQSQGTESANNPRHPHRPRGFSSTTTVTAGGVPRVASRPNFNFDPDDSLEGDVVAAAVGSTSSPATAAAAGRKGAAATETSSAVATDAASSAPVAAPSNWSTASTVSSERDDDDDLGAGAGSGLGGHGVPGVAALGNVVDALTWAPDRGRGREHAERERARRPSLVEGGARAGESRVAFAGGWRLQLHAWARDFFISALNTSLPVLLVGVAVVYLVIFLAFGGVWWLLWSTNPHCLSKSPDSGFTFGTAFIFAIATTQTIGYGNTAPNDTCPPGFLVLIVQVLLAIVTEAVVIGVIFARISHPQQRARTIGISQVAVVARRDGVLKFMFRVADLRATQVVEPQVKAYLYTWGQGRTTAEGEHVPVRCEELQIGYIDGALLLPLIIEHTIDERSPLCGHDHSSLSDVAGEIVVTFHGTTEFGNPFAVRRSYLPCDVMWGHQFKRMIKQPQPNASDVRYVVDFSKLHDVEPQHGLAMLPPAALSRLVVGRSARCVPYPLLGENTLCLSDSLCLSRTRSGHVALMVRVGDTYPNQHLEVCVKAYLYRWRPGSGTGAGSAKGGRGGRGGGNALRDGRGGENDGDAGRDDSASSSLLPPLPEGARAPRSSSVSDPRSSAGADRPPSFGVGEPDDFECVPLDVGYGDGSDRLMLWLPLVVKHVIDERSPLWHWATGRGGGMLRDADASVAVTVEGYRYSTAANAMRTRVYSVMRDVRRDHGFCSIVTSPADSPDLKPRVNWAAFHETVKLTGVEGDGGGGGGGSAKGVSFARLPRASSASAPPAPAPAPSAAAPAPPARAPAPAASPARPNLHRNSMDVLRSDAARQAESATASASAPVAAPADAVAAAASAAPPEAGGGMLLPPNLDPDSTFRLRSSAAARARLDESAFAEAGSGEGGEGGGGAARKSDDVV